jgi:hypothetical protein
MYSNLWEEFLLNILNTPLQQSEKKSNLVRVTACSAIYNEIRNRLDKVEDNGEVSEKIKTKYFSHFLLTRPARY